MNNKEYNAYNIYKIQKHVKKQFNRINNHN